MLQWKGNLGPQIFEILGSGFMPNPYLREIWNRKYRRFFFCRCDWAVHSSSVEKPEVDEIDWNLEPFFDMFFPKLVSLINNPIKDVPFKNYVNEVSNEVLAKKKRTISQLGHHFFAAWSSWAAPCLRVQLIGCKSQQKRWSLVAQCLKRGGWMPHG